MLKCFEVTNYRNFKDKIIVDFGKVGGYHFNPECITDNTISKMLIYGRNATGKTNLGKAIMDIRFSLEGVRIMADYFANADSKEEEVSFKYIFQFDDDELVYRYRKISEMILCDEELLLNGVQVFYYDFLSGECKIDNLHLIKADTVVIDRFRERVGEDDMEERDGTLPFLRWLITSTPSSSGSILLKLNDYVLRMRLTVVSANRGISQMRQNIAFYETLDKGDNLQDFEDFLNAMGIECRLELKKSLDKKPVLYFVHETPLPFFETASSGTIALMNLYIRLMMYRESSLYYIDEFDAFYHYEMSERVVKFLKYKYPNTQVILTTHNTNLMTNSLMRPDCLFILSSQGKLTALCDATPRELREGHNLEKLYISGEFEDYE